MNSPTPAPTHVEIVARIIHDVLRIDRPPGAWDRIPDEWRRPYRDAASQSLTKIDTLAAQVAVIAGARP